jgi:hypothetical protein
MGVTPCHDHGPAPAMRCTTAWVSSPRAHGGAGGPASPPGTPPPAAPPLSERGSLAVSVVAAMHAAASAGVVMQTAGSPWKLSTTSRLHTAPAGGLSVHGVLWYLLLDCMGWWAPVCCGMSVHGVL